MPLALVILGTVLLLSGWRGTYADLGARFAADAGGFMPWLVAIIAIGAIGYVNELKGFSNALLGLVILVILLANHGVFQEWATLSTSLPQAAGDTSLIPQQDQAALQQNPQINIGGTAGSALSGAQSVGNAASGIGSFISKMTGGFFGSGF